MNPHAPASPSGPTACALESVIATDELKQRGNRPPKRDLENQTELELARAAYKVLAAVGAIEPLLATKA
jgi:hypothetical protein